MKLTPSQKEQLSRPRPFLFLAILGTFGLPWIVLFWSGLQARQQQAQMDAEANTFFAQFPTYPQNAAAKQFDQLAADLGFIPNDSSGLIRVQPEAELAYQAIEALLSEFLQRQTAKISGPLDAPPPPLSAYLDAYRETIAAAQAQILKSEAPQWEMNFERMFGLNYPFPGFVNAFNVQKLLLLSAIDTSKKGQPEQALVALEASWRLNQAIARRPDLVSQMLVSVVSAQQAGILRHLEQVPDLWQARLVQQTQQQSVLAGLQFDAWLQYKISQKSLMLLIGRPSGGTGSEKKLLAALSYWFSPAYHLELTAIDTTQTVHRALYQLSTLDVCSTSQPVAEQIVMKEETARWNSAVAVVPAVLARRWQETGDRALTLELTQKVLRAKQLSPVGQWPDQLPDLASKVCPGERWVYKRTNDNTITLSLSAQRDAAPVAPLSYRSADK